MIVLLPAGKQESDAYLNCRDRDKDDGDKESNVPDDPYTQETVVAYPAYPLPASVIAAKAPYYSMG